MKRRTLYIVTCILAVLIFSSCEHKDLCYDHSHLVNVKVVFDWRNAPDAVPKSMSLYMYPSDGGEVMRFDFTGRDGGTIRVPLGCYHVLCLNSDTETVRYRNTESRETFEVYTREADLLSGLSRLGILSDGAPRADGTENERVALAPDMIWSDHVEDIGLELTDEEQTVTLYPRVSVCTYTVEIRNAENLKYVSGISGTLSSLAGGLLPGIGADALTDERVSIPFDASVSTDKTIVTGGWLTFGHCPSAQNRHLLTIYAVLADNSKWYYTYDVTEQVHEAPDQRHVHIILDKLPLPKPIVNGGGFQSTVDDWQTVNVDIEM